MSRRRPSLSVRVSRTLLIVFGPLMFALAAVILGVGSLPEGFTKATLMVSMLWTISSLVLIPALLSDGSDSPPDQSDADGGGGGGPRRPPAPSRPRGGIPLPDAEQARVRVRDHSRRPRGWVPLRRTTREPARPPVRSPQEPRR